MAAQSNGRAKKPKNPTQNGHLNGHIDNTKLSAPTSRSSRPRRTLMGSLANIVARLVTWYIILTIAFRCPSSISRISETSPQICKPYLQARSYAAPYVDPYYQTYVAPQVEKIQPYTDRFESQIYTPVASFTKEKYATYGAHRVDAAQKYLEAEWDRTIRPQIQNAQEQAKLQYDIHLGPHVKTVSDAVAPYYEQTKESMLEIYHLTLLPAYEAMLPYSQEAYKHGHYTVTHIIFPYVRYGKDVSWTFISRTVWPQLRILYGDNVEPQLVRIRERLGRHRDQQKIESIVDALESESPSTVAQDAVPTSDEYKPSSTASEAAATPSGSGWDILNDLWPSDSLSTATEKLKTNTATRPEEPKLTGAELREKLNSDLRQWQTKFAVAADKGSEDLEERVAEITDRQIGNGVKGHGSALVVQLEETADSVIATFKELIKDTVKELSEDATEADLESAYEKCIAKTRELGLAVKEKAQAVRNWKAKYERETDNLVRAAVRSTVEVLERIHGLGLQEVGMRWAWTDGVTYKDWKNYHKLRNTLNEWQAEVEAVGSQHPGLKAAHDEANALEEKAMATAQKMVGELVRLKDVSKWKIWAGDATDDFSNKKVPARVFKVAESIASSVEDMASQVSDSVFGSETPATESVASQIKEYVSDASSKISESLSGSDTPVVESASSNIKEKASESGSKLSEAVIGSESSTASDIKSSASDATESVKSAVEEATEAVKEKTPLASEEPKRQKVMGGAMAQAIIEAKEIVFDDEDPSYSERLQEMVNEAGDQAAELSKAVSEILLGASKTQGTVESATSVASEKFEAALAAASSVLYGTEQGAVESATSVASEKWAEALTAASYAVYGTPTPTAIYHAIQVEASSRYDQALKLANGQYSNAKSQLSELVSGTPKPAHEAMLSMIEHAYSDSVAAASERLQVALQYTDSVKSYVASPTQGYFESVSSVAASKLSEGLNAATAQFAAQPTGALDGARRQYYEAIGLAHARYSEFLGAASSAVYGHEQGAVESLASVASESAASVASQASAGVVGSETHWAESVASQASQNWESLIAKASEQVYGAPTPWAESVYSQAGEYGAQATEAAAAQYAAVQAVISDLVIGKEPDFTASVYDRLSSAYYSGVPDAFSSVSSYADDSYSSASSYASENYDAASSYVSSIFTPPAAIETILAQASEQINAAVESASIAVYGTPKGYGEQASESVASAYSSVSSQASVAIWGTQQASDNFAALASSAQASISEAIFGPPSASGYAASATKAAESVYSSLSSQAEKQASEAAAAVSAAIYGPKQGAIESASSRLASAVEVANSRIAEFYADATKGAGEAASSLSSVVSAATQSVKDEL